MNSITCCIFSCGYSVWHRLALLLPWRCQWDYKEPKQFKTFLTLFGPVLALTPDPPVRLQKDQRGGTTVEITIWGAWTNCFSHPSIVPARPTCASMMPHAARCTSRCRSLMTLKISCSAGTRWPQARRSFPWLSAGRSTGPPPWALPRRPPEQLQHRVMAMDLVERCRGEYTHPLRPSHQFIALSISPSASLPIHSIRRKTRQRERNTGPHPPRGVVVGTRRRRLAKRGSWQRLAETHTGFRSPDPPATGPLTSLSNLRFFYMRSPFLGHYGSDKIDG
jgi:hypothetical protein